MFNSTGIINRDQRHNVGLFQSVFSPNPFDQVTDDELERYKRNVERKAKGLPTEEEEEEMERLKRATIDASAPAPLCESSFHLIAYPSVPLLYRHGYNLRLQHSCIVDGKRVMSKINF